MSTVNLLGLVNHGHRISDEEFENADFEPGYKYELIDGRLYVSAEPNMPEDFLETWLRRRLENYSDVHPEVIAYLTTKARVFVPGRRTTIPEPDLTAYREFPHEARIADLDWQNVSPFLVVEVLYASDPYKDLIRNVELYLRVPSIREYWIVDGRYADKPTLIVYRRRGDAWLKPRRIEFGETYTTPLLPGFKLIVDPHRR